MWLKNFEPGHRICRLLLEVPSGATVVFSAHGVSPEVRRNAKAKNLKVIDATCPLVTKVHLEAINREQGFTIVLIGHKGHEEVIGTMGEAPQDMVLISSKEEVGLLNPPDPKKLLTSPRPPLAPRRDARDHRNSP